MKTLTIATLLALTGTALAQPGPGPAPAPLPTPDADLDAEPPPPPLGAPAVAPEAPRPAPREAPPAYGPTMAAPVATPAPAPRALRPVDTSVGLGLGWNLPADLQAPNAASARLRLRSGLTLEPHVVLVRGDATVDQGTQPDDTTSNTQLSLGLLVRKPVRENGKADFDLVAGAEVRKDATDPEGDDNDRSTTYVTISYGLAVGYWFTPHFHLSVTGTNPIYSYFSQVNEQGVPGEELTQKSSLIGAVFEPQLTVMVHLYL